VWVARPGERTAAPLLASRIERMVSLTWLVGLLDSVVHTNCKRLQLEFNGVEARRLNVPPSCGFDD